MFNTRKKFVCQKIMIGKIHEFWETRSKGDL